MTDQLTDEYLEKRAEELAMLKFPSVTLKTHPWENAPTRHTIERRYRDGRTGFRDATLSALKVHRESLRQLELVICNEDCPSNYFIHPPDPKNPGEMYPCNCGRDQHIATYKELLGVSQ